ncbi:YgdI/YgdR family lipoprotein [Sphaerotilaceae bacterium SBD11-9]
MNYRLLTLAAAIALTTVACSSTQYIISTKEGRMLEAHGKPKYDEKTGMYVYEDADGKKTTVLKSDVVQIMER